MKKIVNNFYYTLISKAEEIHEKDFISFLNLNRIKKEVKVAEIEYFKLKGLPCDGGFLSKKDTLDFLKKTNRVFTRLLNKIMLFAIPKCITQIDTTIGLSHII